MLHSLPFCICTKQNDTNKPDQIPSNGSFINFILKQASKTAYPNSSIKCRYKMRDNIKMSNLIMWIKFQDEFVIRWQSFDCWFLSLAVLRVTCAWNHKWWPWTMWLTAKFLHFDVFPVRNNRERTACAPNDFFQSEVTTFLKNRFR